jgi:hypothetical protein
MSHRYYSFVWDVIEPWSLAHRFRCRDSDQVGE